MKKTSIFYLLFFAVITAYGQPYPSSSYELSPDGKTLLKWKGEETLLDMQADNVLKNVEHIGVTAFTNCKVKPPEADLNWYPECESTLKLEGITFPDGLKKIGDYAFAGCANLKGNLVLPDGITYIGEGAFANCYYMEGALIIPKGVTVIKDYSFIHTNFSCLTIPEGVVSIGNSAFRGSGGQKCGNLVIPNSVKTIGYKAFKGWSNIHITSLDNIPSTLTIGSGVTSIGEGAFYNSNFAYIYSYAIEPPSIGGGTTFALLKNFIKMYVPYGSVQNYKNSEIGNLISKEQIVGMPSASIKSSKELAKTINFYPSPVEDFLNIESRTEIVEYTIYNIIGKEILKERLNNSNLNLRVDMSNIPSGVYLIDLKTKEGKAVIKVVKK